jgi:hypothetical protein
MPAPMTDLVAVAGDAVQRLLQRFGLHVSRSAASRFAATRWSSITSAAWVTVPPW